MVRKATTSLLVGYAALATNPPRRVEVDGWMDGLLTSTGEGTMTKGGDDNDDDR